MGERNVRYPAGPNEEGRTHRVGLTRHCLTSGLVQLPYALKDALPEGALLAYDLDRDESIEVVFVPPRRLEGLDAFFRAHDLHVNDEIEVRVVAGEPPDIRVMPLRRARSGAASDDTAERAHAPSARRSGDGGAGAGDAPPVRRQVSVWHSVRDERPARARLRYDAHGAPDDPGGDPDARAERQERTSLGQLGPDATLEHLPAPTSGHERHASTARPVDPDTLDVVERFGSVTVRRLGTGTVGRAPSSSLDASTPGVPPEPVLGIDPDAAFAASEQDATDPIAAEQDADGATFGAIEEAARHGNADLDAALEAPTPDDLPELHDDLLVGPETDVPADARADTQADTASDAHADAPSEARSTAEGATDPEVRQVSLFDELASAARPPSASPASNADPAPAALPSPPAARKRPKVLGRRGRTARPSTDAGEEGAADANSAHEAEPASAPTPAPGPTSRRAREEALSRAGDLRSRIIRWMLAPETPVIVSIEQVQEAFELPGDVARDIVEGILESPPPSLRLTRLRPDMLRVSRITVEQSA